MIASSPASGLHGALLFAGFATSCLPVHGRRPGEARIDNALPFFVVPDYGHRNAPEPAAPLEPDVPAAPLAPAEPVLPLCKTTVPVTVGLID